MLPAVAARRMPCCGRACFRHRSATRIASAPQAYCPAASPSGALRRIEPVWASGLVKQAFTLSSISRWPPRPR
eukprot:7454794-Pyramimonas_sp.AAC.1